MLLFNCQSLQMINSTLYSQLDQLTIHLLFHYWEPYVVTVENKTRYSLNSDPTPSPPHLSSSDIMVTLEYICNNWCSLPNISYIAMLAKTRVCF